MAYQALYRTYRPSTFSEVIGQEHISTILKNQVISGSASHAYLLCGTRGTGKTTTARILARAVNCLHPENGEPCGVCDACKIMQAPDGCPDITEMDAASNNGVDDIRSLIEKIHYAPLQLKYRVFIIDEAHMVTREAFNALLKTLEEPPEYLIFILATTEPQKLPATIISRCQRFDFHRLSIENIIQNLKHVLLSVHADVDEPGLMRIARSANGGMRDALSLLDQCLSFCGNHVSESDVNQVLGCTDDTVLFDMADALLASDSAFCIRCIDDIIRSGRDLSVFANDLGTHFRSLLLAKTCGRCESVLDCTSEAMDRYLLQASSASEAKLLLAMETILKSQSQMKFVSSPRVLLETTVIRICRPETAVSVDALEARVCDLENKLKNLTSVSGSVQQEKYRSNSLKEEPVISQASPVDTPRASEASKAESSSPLPEQTPPADRQEESSPSPAPSVQKAGASADCNPKALFNELLSKMVQANALQRALLIKGTAEKLENGVLTVVFGPQDEFAFKSVNTPLNISRVNGILSELRPGTTIYFILQNGPDPSDGAQTEARLREMFGDIVKVKD